MAGPTEIKQPSLAQFEHEPEFYTSADGEWVIFQCPVDGKTTSGSSYPRSELRQMKNNGADEASWGNSKNTWTLECTLKFTHLPGGKPHCVGMQIHDSQDDVSVLRLEGTTLYATKGDDTHHQALPGTYNLGDVLNMKVVARAGGGIRWYRDGVQVAAVSGTYSGCYFKAGCYVQANESNGTGYGEVQIKRGSLKFYKTAG